MSPRWVLLLVLTLQTFIDVWAYIIEILYLPLVPYHIFYSSLQKSNILKLILINGVIFSLMNLSCTADFFAGKVIRNRHYWFCKHYLKMLLAMIIRLPRKFWSCQKIVLFLSNWSSRKLHSPLRHWGCFCFLIRIHEEVCRCCSCW